MGQQQLLLLVLSIVIVSMAVYIGIDFFGMMMQQRHADMLVNHAVSCMILLSAFLSTESYIGFCQVQEHALKWFIHLFSSFSFCV